MNEHVLTIAYRVLPFVPGAYAVGTFAFGRPANRSTLWALGLILIAGIVAAVTAAVHAAVGPGVSVGRLVAAYATLYGLPMLVLLGTATVLRARRGPKLTSVTIILVVAIAMHRVGGYASGSLLDFVNASD